jgi:predicted Zn-dependent protease
MNTKMNNDENIKSKQIDAIERYLNNSMNASEREEFELRLSENQEFKNQFEEMKVLILGIESAALKNQIDAYHTEFDKKSNSQRIKKIKSDNPWFKTKFLPYAVAASILLALGLFLYNNETPSNQEVFAKHFVPDPGLPTIMGSSNNFEFYDGMVDYKRAEYGAAIEKWLALQQKDNKNDTINYFLGVAFLAQGNENKAKKYLINAAQNSKGFLENETYYYLGLAYLKANNLDEARKNLKKSTINESKIILAELSK